MKKIYRTTILLHILITVLFVCCFNTPTNAQQLLDKRISLHEVRQPISVVLEHIETAAGLHFSYNSQLFDRNRKLSISVDNLSVKQTLKTLLRDPTLRFNETEQDIIIYRPANLEAASKAFWRDELARLKQQTDAPKKPNQLYDTVLRYLVVQDTVLDTLLIRVTDTSHVVIRDTVWDTLRSMHNNINQAPHAHLSIQLGAQAMFPLQLQSIARSPTLSTDVAQLQTQEQTQLWTGAFTALRFEYQGMSIATGLRVLAIANTYKYSLHRKWIDSSRFTTSYDTSYTNRLTDSYYEYNNTGDTVWHHNYVREIAIKEKHRYSTDSVSIDKQGSSRIVILQIPIMLGYSFHLGSAWRINAGGGLIANILLSSKGNATGANTSSVMLSDLKQIPFAKPYWSVCGQLQTAYSINSRWSVFASLVLEHSLQSMYANNYLISKQYTALGSQLGIEFKLSE